jgi:dihydroneopterin aldolase
MHHPKISMTQYPHSCVRLVNMVFYAHHGVLKEEHTVGGKYEVDAELLFDFTDAAQNDDITKTIDYGSVYKKIQEALTLKKYFLIEAVAYELAHDLLRDFPILGRVAIKVRKRNPPVDGICDYAEADFAATRS